MHVREMQIGDYAAVQRVRADNGLVGKSPEFWRHLRCNPHRSQPDSPPIGWVLEDGNGTIVGIFEFYPVRCRSHGGRVAGWRIRLRSTRSTGWQRRSY